MTHPAHHVAICAASNPIPDFATRLDAYLHELLNHPETAAEVAKIVGSAKVAGEVLAALRGVVGVEQPQEGESK